MNDAIYLFIYLFIFLTCRKATEALIHREGNSIVDQSSPTNFRDKNISKIGGRGLINDANFSIKRLQFLNRVHKISYRSDGVWGKNDLKRVGLWIVC